MPTSLALVTDFDSVHNKGKSLPIDHHPIKSSLGTATMSENHGDLHIAQSVLHATPPISVLPCELLSKIFSRVVDQARTTPGHPPFSACATDLLAISHVCSLFRAVANDDPSLWAMVPFINGVSCQFLRLILTRSQELPLTLSVMEDETWPQSGQVWGQLLCDYKRVTSLRIEVAEDYDGIKAMLFLTLPVPRLEHCTIKFHGQRSIALDRFANPVLPFNGHVPSLRALDLINCTIPPKFFNFPGLTTISMCTVRYQSDFQSTLISPCEFLHWRGHFKFLRALTLSNSIRAATSTEYDNVLLHSPIDLPVLEHVLIDDSLEVCRQMAGLLHFPSSCTRTIVIGFPRSQQFTIDDASRAAEVASAFIPPNVRYIECDLKMGSGRTSLHFGRGEIQADIVTFDVSELKFSAPGLLGLLIEVLSIPAMAVHNVGPSDAFLCWLWEALASQLRGVLDGLTKLHLSFGEYSTAPHILRDFLGAMNNIQTLETDRMDVWNNPCFLVSSNKPTFPRLRNLTLPLDGETTPSTVGRVSKFLADRTEIERVTFQANSEWVAKMGRAAVEDVCGALVHITQEFPVLVSVDWVDRRIEDGHADH